MATEQKELPEVSSLISILSKMLKEVLGGIWYLWNERHWEVEVTTSSSQFVDIKVARGQDIPWFLTIVFGSLYFSRRQSLLKEFAKITSEIDRAWAMARDFNSVMAKHEREGGSPYPSFHSLNSFCCFVQECDLIDVGFQGYPFTWQQGDQKDRLDKILISLSWRLHF